MFFSQVLINSIVIGTQVLLLAVPLYLIYSVSKVYHLGLGATAAAVAYALYFGVSLNWPLGISIFFAVLIAVIVGMLAYLLLVPFIKKRETTFGLLISFAFGLAIESLLAIMFGTGGRFIMPEVLPMFYLGKLYITVPGIFTIVVGVVLALIILIVVLYTPYGRALRAIAENSIFSSSLAINASKICFAAFIIASVLAGFIGIMTGLNTALTPQIGFNLIIMAFVALLIGGNNLKATIIATYLITLIPELIISLSKASWHLSANWKMFLVFIIAVILLLIRPQGLLSGKRRIS